MAFASITSASSRKSQVRKLYRTRLKAPASN